VSGGGSERLVAVLQRFNAARAAPGGSTTSALRLVRAELAAIAREIQAGGSEDLPYAVSLIYLVVGYSTGVIPHDIADRALLWLQGRPVWAWRSLPLEDFVLQGADVLESPSSSLMIGCSLMNWDAFRKHYAEKFGVPKVPSAKLEKLWESLEEGNLGIADADVDLGGTNGVVWFTDRDALETSSPRGGVAESVDIQQAYELLALDWSKQWEYHDGNAGVTRSILLSVPITRRARSAHGLRVPTALEGWGCLLFAPKRSRGSGDWPVAAGFTSHPLTEADCLPEAVHGTITAIPGAESPFSSCGRLAKAPRDRLAECGKVAVERALQRLAEI
jgi:hypothetical protein